MSPINVTAVTILTILVDFNFRSGIVYATRLKQILAGIPQDFD
jgi:hypothetical protein